MKRVLLVLFLLLPALSFSSIFSGTEIPVNNRGHLFEIHGSNTIGAALAPALVEGWMVENGLTAVTTVPTAVDNEKLVTGYTLNDEKITVFIAAHGSGTGFKQIKNGSADIAAASRPVKKSENDLFDKIDLTKNPYETVVAIDGIAVITHPDIPINDLTIEQVGQLFSGEISNWQQLDGPDLAVTVYARDDRSGTYDTFKNLVLKRGYQLTKKARRYESNDHLSAAVSSTPGAIGFTSLASVHDAKAIRIADGDSAPMPPEHTNIATEDYPLARRLYFYQADSQNPFVESFLSFAKSSEGQDVVDKVGFISQNLDELPMTVADKLPRGYTFLTENSKRVTTNFRFVSGTLELDNKGKDDIYRLAEYMAKPENQDRKILLIGFSEAQHDELQARLLSEVRVIAVKRQLAAVGVVSSAVTGYGEINPVASNANIKYALRNQRVEVWIR